MNKPIALDLCCGKGGWARGFIAEGWNVVGVDIQDFSADYPGEFILELCWPRLRVKSSPAGQCRGRERANRRSHRLPWSIAADKSLPLILENVRAAQNWLGRSAGNCGPFHLWGNVPIILPVFTGKKKESFGSKQRADRAIIPFHLAVHVARAFR